ncbi:TPA: SRPBCC domain-containing protein, partial [Acinetobacter baumannii]|nr:SRPBCC domain-containing protein [Acinetobacter baumannii]
MQPVIKKLDKYHLEWEGKFYINGLFNGRHQFIFTKIDANTTQLVQAEDFNGLLVP